MNLFGRKITWRSVLKAFLFALSILALLAVLSIGVDAWLSIPPAEQAGHAQQAQRAYQTVIAAITAGAIVGTVLIGWIAYNVQSITARRQKTFDVIYRQCHDKDIIEILDVNRHIRNKYAAADDAITLQSVRTNDQVFRQTLEANGLAQARRKLDFDYIMGLLNYYETLAIGVENEALDEALLKSWWRTNLVRDWTVFKDFVIDYRKEARAAAAFCKFEALANAWANEGEKPFC